MRMRGQARTGAVTFFLKKIFWSRLILCLDHVLIFGERHLRRVLIVPVYSEGLFWCLVFDVCWSWLNS
jgi:hypothetical protein